MSEVDGCWKYVDGRPAGLGDNHLSETKSVEILPQSVCLKPTAGSSTTAAG